MKRFISLVFAIVCLAACQKAPFLTMTGSRSYSFTREGGSQTFAFSCNRDWRIASSESWIRISPSSGTASDGDISVTITCAPNTTYDPRTATITVTVEELTETISVSQATGLGLIVSPTSYDLTNAEQSIEVEVQQNVNYSIEVDDACKDWIKKGGTKALSTDKVTFNISANTTYDDREGKITFKQTDGDLVQTVTVRQSQTNGLFITTPDYNLSNESHTLSVEVKANVQFEVTSGADWIKYVETKALTPSTIVLNIEANESYDNRTGIVSVKQKNGDLTGTITINQKQTDFLSIDPKSFEVSNEGQSVSIEVKNNTRYSVVIPDEAKSWISIQSNTQTKALVDDQVVLVIAKNATYDNREASVTIKQVDGSLAGTVQIKQAYGEGLVVENSEYEVGQQGGTIEVAVQTNVEFEVTPEEDWIHHVKTKALSSSSIILNVDKNESTSKRVGIIEIVQKNGSLKQTVTVKQSGQIAVNSITLDKTELRLLEGASESFVATVKPNNAADKTVIWTSSDESVATINPDGVVKAVSKGTATIKATANDGSGVYAECSVKVMGPCPEGAVDLGLSVYWATRNLCESGFVSSPEDCGDYYAWGETVPYYRGQASFSWKEGTEAGYSWASYKWCNGSNDSLTKYNTLSSNGTVDNKIILDPEDDVAHVKLGGSWRMPTEKECSELKTNCVWKWVTNYNGTGMNGRLVTGPNGNSIFLPAAGYRQDTNLHHVGYCGPYWSSSLYADAPVIAYRLYIDSGYTQVDLDIRCYGFSVRPVTE